jgi:hypothetical protein
LVRAAISRANALRSLIAFFVRGCSLSCKVFLGQLYKEPPISGPSIAGDNIPGDLPQANDDPGLGAFALQADKTAGIAQTDFLARAWRVANDKARELGWIV